MTRPVMLAYVTPLGLAEYVAGSGLAGREPLYTLGCCIMQHHAILALVDRSMPMEHNPHPKGDQHWTRRAPERIRRGPAAPGAKLSQLEIDLLRSAHYDLGAKPAELARLFSVSRVTVWRHLRARAILDSDVARETAPPAQDASASV